MAKDVLLHKTARATTKWEIDAEHAHSAQLVHHQINKEPHVLPTLFNQLLDQTANATKLLTETTNVRTAHKDKPLIMEIKIVSLHPKTNALEIKLEETSLTVTDAQIAKQVLLQIRLELDALLFKSSKQDQTVAVIKLLIQTINVNSAQEVNSEILKPTLAILITITTTRTPAVDSTKSKVHGRTATNAPPAHKVKLLTDKETNVSHKLWDQTVAVIKSSIQTTSANSAQEVNLVTLKPTLVILITITTTRTLVVDSTKSKVHGKTATNAPPAHKVKLLTDKEINVLLKSWDQSVAVLKLSTQTINANHAQEDNSQTIQEPTALFRTSTTSTTMDLTISNALVTKSEVHGKAAMLAEPAKLELSQMLLELLVLL